MGAGGSMLIQKGTTGHVDSRRAAIDTAIGAIPLGGTARLIGTGVRELAGKAATGGSRFFGGQPSPELFYRAMSNAEHGALQASRRITPRGESFVTQDLAYSRQLAARHPDKYETFVQFDMQPGTRDALVAAGARNDAKIVGDAGYGHLPLIARGQPNVVHVKGEGDSITFGLRPGSAHIFNDRIMGIKVIE